MKKIFIALFVSSIFSSLAYANDTTGTILPTGGVVFEKQDGIKMQAEALYIRPYQEKSRQPNQVVCFYVNTTNLTDELPAYPAAPNKIN